MNNSQTQPRPSDMATKNSPLVSVIIVVRNGALDIADALESIRKQDYAPLEVIVVDGMSNDGTRELAEDYIREKRDFTVRLLDNPGRIQAPGWNIGIRAARGEYVLRLDAVHCRLEPNYVQTCLQTLQRLQESEPAVAATGGRRRTVAANRGVWAEAIALAQCSRFGVGNATYRLGITPGYTDTLGTPLYRRRVLFEVGLFNESLGRSEDNELHTRLRRKGFKLYFVPQVSVVYHPRNTLSGIAPQMFHNGWWVSATLVRLRQCPFGVRHFAPFGFAVFLLAGAALGCQGFKLALGVVLGVVAIYIVSSIAAAVAVSRSLRFWRVVAVFWLMHACYAAGTAAGFFAGKRRPAVGQATAPGANLGH